VIDALTPTKAAIAGAAALLLVLLVGWFLFVSPQRSKAAKLDTQIGEARTQLAVAEALLRGTDKRTADLARLTAAMPSDVRMPGILRELAAQAENASVRINSITPQAATPIGSYFTIPLSITLEGRYLNIARFLSLLNGRTDVVASTVAGRPPDVKGKGRLYSVPQIQLSGSADAGGLLQANMTIDTYTFSGATATPTPTTETTTTPESSTASASEPPQTP